MSILHTEPIATISDIQTKQSVGIIDFLQLRMLNVMHLYQKMNSLL